MDGEALTFGDVQTVYFWAVGFLGSTFLAWANKQDNFLMEGNGGGWESINDVDPLFSGLFQLQSKISSISYR